MPRATSRALCALVISLSGCRQPEPPLQRLTVEVTGDNFEWIFRYPGADGVLGSADDVLSRRDLHVPVGAECTIVLKSRDYVYSMALPGYGCREIAVPDLEFTMKIRPGAEGASPLKGDNMCGYTHPGLLGQVIAEAPQAFRERMSR